MEPYVGEIRLFAGDFAPRGWVLCDGRLLSINDYEALYVLIGTTYGSDSPSTFRLPDLRGRVPVHMGQGPGLSSQPLGNAAGTESVALTANQMPVHSHAFSASLSSGNDPSPTGNVLGQNTSVSMYLEDTPSVSMSPLSSSAQGDTLAHDNLQPYTCLNYIIALEGIFPTTN